MPRLSSIGARHAIVALLALVLLLALLPTRAAGATFTDSDADGASDIVEEVFGSDSAVATSLPETADWPFLSPSTTCIDGMDNDGDGQTDVTDAGCIDSDGSYPSDETETILGSDPNNDESFPEDSRLDTIFRGIGYPLFTCSDQEDGDGDGLTDAADPGCTPVDADGDGFEDYIEKALGADWENASSEPEHVSVNPGSCADTVDNDGDTLTDGSDEGCVSAPNDNFVDAIDASALPFTHTAKAAAATVEFGEQQASCFYSEESERGTLWYTFTAPADGPVLIDTFGTDLLAGVAVWKDGLFSLAQLDCNSVFFYYPLPSANRFAFTASAGETYYIQLERFSTNALGGIPFVDLGRVSFHMEATAAPANDDFADAQTIASLPAAPSGDTVAATFESGEPDATCRFDPYPTNSVWYRYTPAADEYVLASITDADFSITVGVFEGASVGSLKQQACGNGELAFHALAGHTYYVQVAGASCSQPGGAGEVQIASICIAIRGGHFALHLETFELPACAPPQFTHPDPAGDTKPHFDVPDPVDITSVAVGFSSDQLCVTVAHDSLLAPANMWAEIQVDTDLDRSTGYTPYPEDTCGLSGIGVEFDAISYGGDEGLLLGRSTQTGYIIYADGWYSYVIPLGRVDGDDTLRFNVESFRRTGNRGAYFSDCAPNGGNITCLDGVCAFSPFRNGDANCSGPADAIDALIVLQYGAGLVGNLACPDAADVNGNNVIESLDALLVLQYTAGLIDTLPPPPPPPCVDPPVCPPI